MHLRNFSRPYTQLFYKLSAGATETEELMGGCNYENLRPIKVPKCHRESSCFFMKKLSKSSDVSQSQCLEERKKLRFTFQGKKLVFHPLAWTLDTFLEVLLTLHLEWWSEGKDLSNQNLLTTLFAYSLTWYTQISLSTKMLATQRFLCCAAFPLFQSSNLDTFQLLDNTWAIRRLVT